VAWLERFQTRDEGVDARDGHDDDAARVRRRRTESTTRGNPRPDTRVGQPTSPHTISNQSLTVSILLVHFHCPRDTKHASIWWRCDPSATFEQCKAAADRLLATMPPHEPYSTDCFKRAHDKLLWDPRYGKRVYGQIRFKPASSIGDVFAEGDEIVCVAHLHKQWSKTCNALSESRLATIDRQRARAGEEVREDIVKQATKEHLNKSVKVRPTKFNSWKPPLAVGGAAAKLGATAAPEPNATLSKTMSKTMSETRSKGSTRGSSKSSSGQKSGSGASARALSAKN
jgi:hypothetical protein